jgi:tRNA modification GTPase
MPARVCVLTGRGYGAIGSVLLSGRGAKSILSKVFEPAVSFETGGIFHGRIIEGGQILDQVVVGCEGINQFVIHCHGNPILVQKITELFIRGGAQLTDLENAVFPIFDTRFEKEAYTEQLKAVTIEGVKIIQSQVDDGLSAAVRDWIDKDVSIEEVRNQCHEILKRSRIARRIIRGVKIVLAGPANSGKSTLLNTLAGSQKAIVSDIAGTTRDWVSAFINIGPLRAEVIDTAGLGENAIHNAVDKSAQERTGELIKCCDCVLWIKDGTNPLKIDHPFPAGTPIIVVWNKVDLLDDTMSAKKSEAIRISAKNGDGIDTLLSQIQNRLQVCDYDCSLPAAFTGRQEKLLEAIAASGQQEQIREYLIKFAG